MMPKNTVGENSRQWNCHSDSATDESKKRLIFRKNRKAGDPARAKHCFSDGGETTEEGPFRRPIKAAPAGRFAAETATAGRRIPEVHRRPDGVFFTARWVPHADAPAAPGRAAGVGAEAWHPKLEQ
jgi:hypothetical protein